MNYIITRSCRKTLAIHIKPDGSVEVRAPIKLAKSEIERFLAAKAVWIDKKQTQIAALQDVAPLELPKSKYDCGEFERIVSKLVDTWGRRLGVSVTFVGIRKMSTRWGSCTAKTRRIRLNSALEYCPPECLEYVIVHELAHLLENNHSSRFWAIVADAMPNYKEFQAELRNLQKI